MTNQTNNTNFRPSNGSGPNKSHNGGSGHNRNFRSNNGPSRSGGRGGRGGPRSSGEAKTRSITSEKAHYLTRRTVVDHEGGISGALENIQAVRNIKGTGIGRGNLAMSHINPVLQSGPLMQTNAPEAFESGAPVRIIPLGGTSEVGMNMTAIECGDDIIVVDTGFGFGGGERFPGVDYIIPDTSYLEQNRHKIRGLIYTHGHLDHIGGAPYILPKLGSIPIFGMPLTLALLKNRLQEFEMSDKFVGKLIDVSKNLRLGVFNIEFFRLNHSIPDVVGLSIDTPMGRILYATDWKFDNTPFDGQLSEYGKIAHLGDQGVRLLLTDSLGIMNKGKTISEMDIQKTVLSLFNQAQGRIIFTTFSTTIARLQHVINASEKTGRKLALVGRSMINNFNVCFQLGYIKVPAGLVVEMKELAKLPPEKVCILSTGSQGEENAALNRMARDEHDQIRLQGGDTVIFSSKPIPGNEDAVAELMARLSRKGVDVYMNKEFDLHVSGHACVEDLKLLFALARPKYLMPIHGNHFMLRKVGELGANMGIPFENNLIVENGRITEMRATDIVVTDEVITESYLLVDGTGVGAVSEVVLEERRQMATEGAIILVLLVNKQKKLIGGPEIISRGFVYMKTSGDLFEEIRDEVRRKFDTIKVDPTSKSFWTELRQGVKTITRDFVVSKTEKDPMIIPVVVQV
jgi:ribonuclease J